MVLNELNNLKINGSDISVELKQMLFEELFKSGKKVTKKALVAKLKMCGLIGANDIPEISGIDGDFKNTLANYAKFCAIFENS